MDFLLKLVGLILVIEGLPWFLSPRGMRRWLRQLFELGDAQLRTAGFVLMSLGLVLVFLATR